MLDRNEVYYGDWIDKLKEIDDRCIDLIVIDPPYIVTKEKWDRQEVVNGRLSSELFRVGKESCSLYVWCGIGEQSQSLIRWFPIFSKDWHFKDLITWKKRRGIGMRRGWLYVREEIMWFVKDNEKFVWNIEKQYDYNLKNEFKEGFGGDDCLSDFKRLTNVWTDIPEILSDKGIEHYTPKPLEALKRIIRVHTNKGDLILDCFAGSGSSGIACYDIGRDFILFEKDREIFLSTESRIRKMKARVKGFGFNE